MGCLFVLISPFVVYGLALLVLPARVFGVDGDIMALFAAAGWFFFVASAWGATVDS